MTDIATVKENLNLYSSESGKTSPLSALPTSSPSLLKANNDQMTIDTELNTSVTNNASSPTNSKREERSKSILSDESSELSDLDSDAETEKMYNGGEESQLAKLAKNSNRNNESHDDTTLQPDSDTFIKEDVASELETEKGNGIEGRNEDNIEDMIKSLRSTEEPDEVVKDDINSTIGDKTTETTESKQDEEEAESVQSKGSKEDVDQNNDESETEKLNDESTNGVKRKLSDTETEEPTKRARNTESPAHDEGEKELNGGDHEVENEGEDEDEEEEEAEAEDGDEELTEEQKIERKKEQEAELEKQIQRKEAIQFLTEIEIDFAKLRDRLYADKMDRFKSELEMCLNGSHPELQSVYSKIDSHREERIKLASSNQKYKLQCIDRQTRARRTAIHQQYYKRVSDFKNKYLKKITDDWYEINKERRTMDLLVPEYSYKIPEYTDELVQQREQLNQEISLLVGLNQYYGFPKAPALKSVEGNELDNDLKAMNIL